MSLGNDSWSKNGPVTLRLVDVLPVVLRDFRVACQLYGWPGEETVNKLVELVELRNLYETHQLTTVTMDRGPRDEAGGE